MSILNDPTVKQFTVINSAGEKTNELDTPSSVAKLIHKAIGRHKLSGSIYSAGSRWDWRASTEDFVHLELTRRGELEDEIPIPRPGWLAFELWAERRNINAREWLAAVLAQGLANDIPIRQMIQRLFPGEGFSPAIAGCALSGMVK